MGLFLAWVRRLEMYHQGLAGQGNAGDALVKSWQWPPLIGRGHIAGGINSSGSMEGAMSFGGDTWEAAVGARQQLARVFHVASKQLRAAIGAVIHRQPSAPTRQP